MILTNIAESLDTNNVVIVKDIRKTDQIKRILQIIFFHVVVTFVSEEKKNEKNTENKQEFKEEVKFH